MSRKKYLFIAILTILALTIAACGGANNVENNSANTTGNTTANTTADTTADESVEVVADPVAQSNTPIMDRVLARGKLICGGRTSLFGFGYLDDDGGNIGFDINLCRAVAAAVLGDPMAIEFVPLDASDRGPALQTAEVDLLSRNVTWTSSRDAQWGNFTTIMFYDGQGFMTTIASGISFPDDFEGATVCVTSGTTTEQNLADFYRQRGWDYEALSFAETAEVYAAYEDGRCDITTSDLSQLFAVRAGFNVPTDHVIFSDTISKEPLTPAVPHGDDVWFDTVKLVMFALINAEELGITQANVEAMKSSEDITTRRLLGEEGDWGYGDLGLSADALANAIAAVGNYGEIYDRYFGVDGVAFEFPRGLNNLWTEGGLIYAPPVK
jgi:general L-amino acid transport system substrate-binding protein